MKTYKELLNFINENNLNLLKLDVAYAVYERNGTYGILLNDKEYETACFLVYEATLNDYQDQNYGYYCDVLFDLLGKDGRTIDDITVEDLTDNIR